MTDSLKNKTTEIQELKKKSEVTALMREEAIAFHNIYTTAYKEKGDVFHNSNVKLIPQKRALRMGPQEMPIPQSRSKTPGRNALVQSNGKGWGGSGGISK